MSFKPIELNFDIVDFGHVEQMKHAKEEAQNEFYARLTTEITHAFTALKGHSPAESLKLIKRAYSGCTAELDALKALDDTAAPAPFPHFGRWLRRCPVILNATKVELIRKYFISQAIKTMCDTMGYYVEHEDATKVWIDRRKLRAHIRGITADIEQLKSCGPKFDPATFQKRSTRVYATVEQWKKRAPMREDKPFKARFKAIVHDYAQTILAITDHLTSFRDRVYQIDITLGWPQSGDPKESDPSVKPRYVDVEAISEMTAVAFDLFEMYVAATPSLEVKTINKFIDGSYLKEAYLPLVAPYASEKSLGELYALRFRALNSRYETYREGLGEDLYAMAKVYLTRQAYTYFKESVSKGKESKKEEKKESI